MALTITHAKVTSGTIDDAVEVDLGDWNDSHTIAGSIAASEVTSGAELSKTDDTNVTLTLGGTPTTALLKATSLTLGWTGTLAASRGGTGLSSLGTGVATALGINVGSAGAFVTFNGALGTPSSGVLTSATGLPISTGLTGAGTGVLTALAVNVGSAGAFVTFNGALGTPSSGTATNLTGTASGLTSGNVTTNANLTGDVTSSGNATTLATVNSNVGSFGSATASVTFTVNGKGLITAASSTTVTPAVGSITGLGTGVATALTVNVGSAGAFVAFNGALGTPSSGVLTSATGLPVSTGISGFGTGVATALAVNVGSAGSFAILGGAFRAHKNATDQTGIASATPTKITFTTEAVDTGSHYDATNSRWTPPAGPVTVSTALVFTTDVTINTSTLVMIYKNGTEIHRGGDTSVVANVGRAAIVLNDQANGTDYYEVFGQVTAGGTGTVNGAIVNTWFNGRF